MTNILEKLGNKSLSVATGGSGVWGFLKFSDVDSVEKHVIAWLTILVLVMTIIGKHRNNKKDKRAKSHITDLNNLF